MKLKELLEDTSIDRLNNRLKKRMKEKLPEAEFIMSDGDELMYKYRNRNYNIWYDYENKEFKASLTYNSKGNYLDEIKIEKILNSMDVSDVKQETKEIRKSSTKLPKKKFNLK